MNASPGARLTPEQLAAFEAIPDDQVSGIKPTLEKLSTSRYLDPAIFEREKQRIFKRAPLPLLASAELPEPNTFIGQDFLDVPVLVTRGRDGVARAFMNVCRHRGAVVCPTGELQKGKLVVCPYHAWSYALDGELVAVPRPEIFDNLDKTEHPLTPLPCVEAGGLIWVGLTPGHDYDFTVETGPLARELQGIQLDRTRLVRKKSYEVRANWKLIMDTTLDSYHVTRLHSTTVAPLFEDSPVVVQPVGQHLRNASARGNFAAASLSDDVQVLRQAAVLTYQVFPGAAVILSPDYISIEFLRPLAQDRTRVDYVMLTHHPEGDERMARKLQRSFDFMDKVFGQEDFWAAEICQKGIASGDIKELLLGGMEAQMRTFHGIVDRHLQD